MLHSLDIDKFVFLCLVREIFVKSVRNLCKFTCSGEDTVLLVMVISVWSVRVECPSLVYPMIPCKYFTFSQPACAYCCSLKTSRDVTAANFTAGINRFLNFRFCLHYYLLDT